jgi:DNA-binding Xre family transcriptional regulator
MANLLLIRSLTKEQNITIRELASRVGIGEAALQALIKSGSTNTSTLERIAKELNVSPSIFFGEHSISTGDISNNTNTPIGIGSTIGDNSLNSNSNNNTATIEAMMKFVDVIKTYQDNTNRLLCVIEKLSEKYGK